MQVLSGETHRSADFEPTGVMPCWLPVHHFLISTFGLRVTRTLTTDCTSRCTTRRRLRRSSRASGSSRSGCAASLRALSIHTGPRRPCACRRVSVRGGDQTVGSCGLARVFRGVPNRRAGAAVSPDLSWCWGCGWGRPAKAPARSGILSVSSRQMVSSGGHSRGERYEHGCCEGGRRRR